LPAGDGQAMKGCGFHAALGGRRRLILITSSC